jgi:hypothetical protein
MVEPLNRDEMTEAERLAAVGCTHAQIAAFLGLTVDQFQARLDETPEGRTTLAQSKILANAAVANTLYKRATEDGDVNAAKFILTHQAEGWREDKGVNVQVNLAASLRDLGRIIEHDSPLASDGVQRIEGPPVNRSEGTLAEQILSDNDDDSGVITEHPLTGPKHIVRDALRNIDSGAWDDADDDPDD